MNKTQKKILYKNMGILFVLIFLCAVFARSDLFSGGETLQDLADRQEAAAAPEPDTSADSTSAETQTAPADESLSSEEEISLQESGSSSLAPESSQTENEADSPENEAAQSEGETAMADRITWQEGFYYESLNDAIKEQITGISYPADDSNAAVSYDTLRYLSVLYYDFNGEPQTGELICHKAVAQDLVEIFYELYEARYPIERIALIDNYQGDDELSMQDNNTSCFNYRNRPSGRLSNHAYGLAVDLNPFYNPYVVHRKDGSVSIAPAGSEAYADREQSFDHKIDQEDLAYTLFIQHGFTWGGSWNSSKDYQHFEKEL